MIEKTVKKYILNEDINPSMETISKIKNIMRRFRMDISNEEQVISLAKVEEMTTEFYRWVRINLGKPKQAFRQSATETFRWVLNDGFGISLEGWHGGGNYGPGRVLLGLFTEKPFEELLDLRFPGDKDLRIAATEKDVRFYKNFLEDVKDKIMELKNEHN